MKEHLKPLITEDEIRIRNQKVVHDIVTDIDGSELVVIGLLKGSFMFMADLVRLLHLHDMRLLIDFMIVSSYGAQTRSSGEVQILRDVSVPIANKKVLLIDDILDSGRTLSTVSEYLTKYNPDLMKTCVLLDKPERREIPFKADFVGFEIPNEFVVGYGLDFDGRYRELPSIFTIDFVE